MTPASFGPSDSPSDKLPFMILKLIGLMPEQVAAIEKAVKHPAWNEAFPFFKSNAKKEFQHEPENSRLFPPIILSCVRNPSWNSYTMEIRVSIFYLSLFYYGLDRLMYDPEHRNLLPLSVLESIFNAAGIFPAEKTAIAPHETHGDLKFTAPFSLLVRAHGYGDVPHSGGGSGG